MIIYFLEAGRTAFPTVWTGVPPRSRKVDLRAAGLPACAQSLSVLIGKRDDPGGSSSGGVSYGTYGVIHNIRLHLFNPAGDSRQVIVRASALAGPAMGAFLVNRAVVEVPLVQQGVPQTLATVPLGPLERRTLFLSTMPEAGSTYPVQVVVSPR